MNKLKFTINATEMKEPRIEVSLGFEEQIIHCLKESTSIYLETITCKKEYYTEGEFAMVRYTFDNLSDEKLSEFEAFSKRLYIAINNAVNHAQN